LRVRTTEYEAHRARKKRTLELILPRLFEVDPKHAERVALCGEQVFIAVCKGCHAKHYVGHNRCMSRFCLDCAHRRSLVYTAKVMERMRPYLDEGYVPHMLTLTIRDGPNLKERLEFLKSSWRRFTHEHRDSRRIYKLRMCGGIRSIEVKIGRGSGQWHPHMHMVYLAPPNQFVRDYEWIMPEWKRATMGQGSVEVHKVKAKEGTGILKAVIECVKYAVAPDKATLGYTKDPERDLRLFAEMYDAIRGARLVNTWGLLRGVDKSAEEEAAKNVDEKKLTEFICQLCGCTTYELESVMADALRDTVLLDL